MERNDFVQLFTGLSLVHKFSIAHTKDVCKSINANKGNKPAIIFRIVNKINSINILDILKLIPNPEDTLIQCASLILRKLDMFEVLCLSLSKGVHSAKYFAE